MLQGMKVDSELIVTNRSDDARKFKTHLAATNGSYSSTASSSQTRRSDAHQLDKNSPCGSEKSAVKTSV